mmetsp:Transcript_58660/g.130675  ORF Transcript_58660/g.130675 Transcript_58660/m.130675 type:complete len:267 (-) Transcript_58660:216-1016(-)
MGSRPLLVCAEHSTYVTLWLGSFALFAYCALIWSRSSFSGGISRLSPRRSDLLPTMTMDTGQMIESETSNCSRSKIRSTSVYAASKEAFDEMSATMTKPMRLRNCASKLPIGFDIPPLPPPPPPPVPLHLPAPTAGVFPALALLFFPAAWLTFGVPSGSRGSVSRAWSSFFCSFSFRRFSNHTSGRSRVSTFLCCSLVIRLPLLKSSPGVSSISIMMSMPTVSSKRRQKSCAEERVGRYCASKVRETRRLQIDDLPVPLAPITHTL